MLSPLGNRRALGYTLNSPIPKSAVWWNPDGATPAAVTGAWQAKGVSSLAAAYLNLGALGNANIDPALIGGAAPTWNVVDGFVCSSATWLKSGIVPGAAYSMIARFSNAITNFGIVAGSTDGGFTAFAVQPARGIISPGVGYFNGDGSIGLPALIAGVLAVIPGAGYRNGVFDVAIGAWAGVSTREIYIGAYNNAGVVFFQFAGNIQALAIYSVPLTGAQILARYNAMLAL